MEMLVSLRISGSVNFYDKYKVRQRPKVEAGVRDYGYSRSPIVSGNSVITEVGGNAGLLVALDKKTDKQIWLSVSKEPAGHNARSVFMNVQGTRCLASLGIRKLTVVGIDDRHRGKTLPQYPWRTAYSCNIVTPAVADNKVMLSSGHNVHRTALLQISLDEMKKMALITLFNILSCVLPTLADQSALPEPLIRIGVANDESEYLTNGPVERLDEGTFHFSVQPPWAWITVGKDGEPLRKLEGLRSFTICGWVGPISLLTGSGGNRIAFNLNYNRSGFDLVHLSDGRLRLAVNEWPDRARNDSSPGKLKVGRGRSSQYLMTEPVRKTLYVGISTLWIRL